MIILYRRTGGRVEGLAPSNTGAFSAHDAVYALVVDPPMPDGADLTVPKVYDGSVMRNATAGEIAGFAAAQAGDDTRRAQGEIDNWPVMIKALVLALVDEINILRQAASLSARTPAQALAAIRAKAATL